MSKKIFKTISVAIEEGAYKEFLMLCSQMHKTKSAAYKEAIDIWEENARLWIKQEKGGKSNETSTNETGVQPSAESAGNDSQQSDSILPNQQ